jgi:hypothetical protein
MIEVDERQAEVQAPLFLEDDSLVVSNEAPSRFWMHSRYKDQAVHSLCAELNHEWMFAMVTFHGGGKISFSVSEKTWARHEGHYPVVMQLLNVVAQDPRLACLQGCFMVWLEDGMWDWCQSYSRRAPIASFGRSISDSTTFLIPDPAFVGALGYAIERKQAQRFAAEMSWVQRRPTIFWRGAATGVGIEGPEWMNTARAKLALAAREICDPRVIDAKITRVQHLPPDQIFRLAKEGIVHDEVPFEEFFKFKYVVDADGYHCAWKSLFLKLMMGSVVLKIDSPFEQWYHRKLIPWRHYVPVSRDVKELKELHQWLLAHDEQARRIAQEGADLISRVNLESALDGVVMTIQSILAARQG